MGDQSKRSKSLGYWKAAMELRQNHLRKDQSQSQSHNQKQKLLLDDEDALFQKSKRPTTTTAAAAGAESMPKILCFVFLSIIIFFVVLSPYCFPALDSSNSMAGMDFRAPLAPFLKPEDSSQPLIDKNLNTPLHPFVLTNSSASLIDKNSSTLLPSSARNETIWCDRSGFRSDICFMKGDIRTQSTSSSLTLYTSPDATAAGDHPVVIQHEKIRPYTRKCETSVMKTIDELRLISKPKEEEKRRVPNCDVNHGVPAVFFSTGGYTGNVYHEFNDGLIPLYITSHHFNKRVVFFILEYHSWWISKYADILSEISDYPAVDFSGDNRTHCFPEAIVGLRIHDELAIDPALMQGTKETNKTILDFRNLLDRAYWPRIRWLIHEEKQQQEKERESQPSQPQSNSDPHNNNTAILPKLVIVSRTGSRAITNENSLVELAEQIGFRVEILRPDSRSELAKIYRSLNSSDAMIGVHGAAMTHFLFMRPGSVFIQVIPLGTEWASESYYGTPARKMGLKYIGYKIFPRESSLYEKYEKDDPVLQDPKSVSAKGWQYTKSIYLDGQNVVLDLKRFKKRLMVAYNYAYGIVMRQQRDNDSGGEEKEEEEEKREHAEEEEKREHAGERKVQT